MKKWLGVGLAGLLLGVVYYFTTSNTLVARVVDGDNIELKDGRRVRYIGVDTPEEGECFRDESIKINEELVMGKRVKLKFDENYMDRFGRYLAYVYVDGEMVNKKLLEEGAGEYFLDTVNEKHKQELVESANKAYKEKRGKWGKCGEGKGCVIKGNVSRMDVRYYHLPEFRHYGQTVVNFESGDRWFCSEEEAVRAGFTKARE